jgi:Uma2 family endonuclease
MSIATERAIRWTTDEYVRMAGLLAGRRTELIDGQVIEMPSVGTAHYTVTQRLLRALAPYAGWGQLSYSDPVIISGFDEPQPDLCVLRHPVDLRKIVPDDIHLLIEVGDTTAEFDRQVKLPRYIEAGVAHVWLVNISDHANPRLEIYNDDSTTPSDLLTSAQRRAINVPPLLGSQLQVAVDIESLFAGLESLARDEYER